MRVLYLLSFDYMRNPPGIRTPRTQSSPNILYLIFPANLCQHFYHCIYGWTMPMRFETKKHCNQFEEEIKKLSDTYTLLCLRALFIWQEQMIAFYAYVTRRCGSNLETVISKHILWIKLMSTARRWMPQNSFHDKPTSVEVRAMYRHFGDITMGAIASQITSLAIVCSTVYSDEDQRKLKKSASLAFVWGIHRGPVNSPHKWPVTRKMFPFDDVIMVRPNID